MAIHFAHIFVYTLYHHVCTEQADFLVKESAVMVRTVHLSAKKTVNGWKQKAQSARKVIIIVTLAESVQFCTLDKFWSLTTTE